MSQGLYLFCLARLSWLPPLPLEGGGLEDRNSLEVVSFQDLAAVCCPVPVEDFSGPGSEERLRDLNWIGPRVVRHQEVVAGVMRHSPVLPTRFGTIFWSAANLQKVLQRHHDPIASFLERMTHQAEWSVKGLLDRSGARERLISRHLAREAARLEALTPGKRYFQEKSLRAASDQELQQWLQEICRELWAELRGYAAEVRKRRVLSAQAAVSDKEMVLNWAFLLPQEAVPGFQTRIQEANARYAPQGLVLEYTGPWPPYSFAPALEPEA